MPKQIITTKAESTLEPNAINISNRKGGVGKTTFTKEPGKLSRRSGNHKRN